jgi:hypothetical protein
MIDYLKFEQSGYKGGILGLQSIGCEVKEIKTKRSSFYYTKLSNIEIEYYPTIETLRVMGSPHFYFNEGLHNRNDFTRLDLYDTLNEICTRLGVDASVATLHGFEFGVNVEVELPPQTIVNRILCKGHLTIEPTEGGYYLGNKNSHARLKIYNKNRPDEKGKYFLRVEVHVSKMAWFKSRKIDVSTLDSLSKPYVLKRLGEILIEELEEVLFVEEVNRNLINKKRDLEFYDRVTVRSAWEGLNFAKRKRQRDRYQRIVEKYSSGSTLSSCLNKLVSDKWNELMLVPPPLKKCNVSTEWENGNGSSEKCNVSTEWETIEPTTGNVMILPLDIDGRNITLKEERDRGNFQKSDDTGKGENKPVLKVWKCSNCREWMEEDKQYCSDSCKQKKGYRNDRSNPRHHAMQRVLRSVEQGGGLFEPLETLILPDKMRALLVNKDRKTNQKKGKNERKLSVLLPELR